MSLVRWEVFKQDTASKPHQAVGSVHAADAVGALFNARHVFARRPAAVSLWVAPAGEILSWTAEELADPTAASAKYAALPSLDDGHTETYQVFCKTSNRRSMTFVDHVGEVEAEGPLEALAAALDEHGADNVLAWWLVPAAALSASGSDDVASWFEPARDKTYKQQSAYGRVRAGAGASQ